MFRGRILTSALFPLLLIGLLILGGYGLVRLGWSQGYAAGLLAAGGEFQPGIPFAPYGRIGLGVLPLLCSFGLLFFLGLFALRVLFFRRHFGAWHKSKGPHGEHWANHWRQGHKPPWYGETADEPGPPAGHPGPTDEPPGTEA